MAYYIISTQTNKINPNLITGEVALFDTEQDFINAKQQWINDNTIINKDNYQYRVATEIEKNQHFDDYLKYKIDNATETTIVVTHKDFQNIDNTSRQPMIDYIIAQHNKDFFDFPYMYIKSTGDLLNGFLAKELIENENAEIERIKQLKIDAKEKIKSKIKNTTNKDTGETKLKEIIYNLYDNTKTLNDIVEGINAEVQPLGNN